MPDVTAYSTSDGTALAGLAESDDLMNLLPADTYNLTLDATSTVTVPALTAGSIAEASPSIGDTLTVTGSNAPSGATYQWEESADGSTGWTDLTGKTSATLDTSTGVTDDYYVRRGVQISGLQSEVFTAAVQVAAAASWTENTVNIPEGAHFETSAWPTTHKSALFLYSGTDAGTSADAIRALMSWDGRSRYWWVAGPTATAGTGIMRLRIGNDNGTNYFNDSQEVTYGDKCLALLSVWEDNDPTTPQIHLRGYVWDETGGTWVTWMSHDEATTSGASLDFGPDTMHIFERSDGAGEDNPEGTITALGVWTSPTAAAIIDVTSSTERDKFFSGSSLVDPTSFEADVAAADASAVLQVGLFGDAADYNASDGPGGGARHNGALTLTKISGTFT